MNEENKIICGETVGGEAQTPEQFKAEKIAAFNANPDAFIHKDDIIIGCVKEGEQVITAIGAYPRVTVEGCLTRLQFMLFSMFLQMETIKEMQAAQGKLIHSSGVPVKDIKKRGFFNRR